MWLTEQIVFPIIPNPSIKQIDGFFISSALLHRSGKMRKIQVVFIKFREKSRKPMYSNLKTYLILFSGVFALST